jgi:hypothetical protein
MRKHLLALTIAAGTLLPTTAQAAPTDAAVIINWACARGAAGTAGVHRASDGARLAALHCDAASPVARVTISDPDDFDDPNDVDWRVILTIDDPDDRPTTCAYAVRRLPARLSCAARDNPELRGDFAAADDPED